MYNIISSYISKLSKDDIYNYATNNHLNISSNEVDFIYSFIKNNYSHILKNPNSFDLSLYKDKFSDENYVFLNKLINKYKRMII